MQNNDFLTEEYTIDTPENVTFGYEVVGIGSRFVAAVIDTIIITVVMIVLAIIVAVLLASLSGLSFDLESLFAETSEDWIAGIIVAIYTLLNFIVFWGYYIFFELIWNGQTPGKQVAKIRVVRTDGNPVGFLQSAVRNLVRFVDFMPTAYGFGLITMFFNKNSRRLGDFAAGTIVIRDKTEVGLADLVGGSSSSSSSNSNSGYRDAGSRSNLGQPAANTDPTAAPSFSTPSFSAAMSAPSVQNDPLLAQFANIRAISTGDYELITDTLARQKSSSLDGSMVQRLAVATAKKLNVDAPSGYGAQASTKFLEEVTEAYRRYQ